MTTSPDFFVTMVLTAWNSQHKQATKLIDSLSDEQLRADVSPGRNSGIYLLGHLTAVHDYLFPILGLGERLHPELEAGFIRQPDKSGQVMPSVTGLRAYWRNVNQQLTDRFSDLSTDAWFGRHTMVTEEDFAREPHRNKLNVVMNRTNHLSYHLGQLMLLGRSQPGTGR